MENKVRLRFSKRDGLRFIGHLDFLRVFQQMIRRSGLPIAYSQGFNPHQIVSFALPLPLGMESVHDYADITLTAGVPAGEIVESLNDAAPRGLHVLAAYPVQGANAAAATVAADYVISLPSCHGACPGPRPGGLDPYALNVGATAPTRASVGADSISTRDLQSCIAKILQSETLIIPKKTKSGIKNTDIRPDIFSIEITDAGLKLRLSAGSARFLNPLPVAEQILQTTPCTSAISRVELYQTDGAGAFKPL